MSTYVEQAEKLYSTGYMGCVMLDVAPVDLDGVIPDEWCYSSPNPARPWISGRQNEFHVTLLYGLLDNANTISDHVYKRLDGWGVPAGGLESTALAAFQSPFEDEPYSCIVAEFVENSVLIDAHGRLSRLPHISTFPDYRPHVTLAYVHRDKEQEAMRAIMDHFRSSGKRCPITWEALRLNLGEVDR